MKEDVNLDEMRLDGAFVEESELIEASEMRFRLSPPHWDACDLPLELEWTTERFDSASKTAIPDDVGGVYTFILLPGAANHPQCGFLCYVGKVQSQSLRDRFKQYLYEQGQAEAKSRRPKVHRFLKRFPKHVYFCYAKVEDPTMITEIEKGLQDTFIPPINERFEGKIGRAMLALQ